jgi:hypothetical protein
MTRAIFAPMKTLAKSIGNAIGNGVEATHAILYHQGVTSFQEQAVLGIDLLVTPAVCTAFALTEVGKCFFRELQRWRRIREKRPKSPSLRGTPRPEELEEDWEEVPRTLEVCLRLGSRLADLEPTLDSSLIYKMLPNGRKRIVARNGGVKGWLRDHRVQLRYNTVMKYKKLAQRIRQVLGLDDRIPLEWVIGGLPEGAELPTGLGVPFETARRRWRRMRKENPTLAGLTRSAEKCLGIQRLVCVRRAPRWRRKGGEKRNERKGVSIISRQRCVGVGEGRVEATREALRVLLGMQHLAGEALHLQNRARRWLEGVSGAVREKA